MVPNSQDLSGIGDRHLNNIMLDVSIGREGMIDRMMDTCFILILVISLDRIPR